MKRNDKGHNRPQRRRQQTVPDAHGDDPEVRVDGREAEDAVADQGQDDGREDEGDVAAHAVYHVPDDRREKRGQQVDQA